VAQAVVDQELYRVLEQQEQPILEAVAVVATLVDQQMVVMVVPV
jgi:hypothetical protein